MFASALVALAEAIPSLALAAPRDPRASIDIPAGSLEMGLAIFSKETGISVGYAGSLPALTVRRLHGRMTAAEALRRLLAGSGLRATALGPLAYRIAREAAPSAPLARSGAAAVRVRNAAPPAPFVDIVVTGQKRVQILRDVPLSLSVVQLNGVGSPGVDAGNRDLAALVEGLALTNLGPGRNRQFIRGVADSPFNGPSQSTVSTQLDEARVTFDGPDPDLRLVDVERVEILKGPQGPLYGSGALGGIFHIVTRKPDMGVTTGSVRLLGEAVAHGDLGGGVEAVLNLPLADDRLAVRAVGYGMRGAGWIRNVGRNDNANVSRRYGGRLALRWAPAPDWTIDLGGTLQYYDVADSQYVTANDDTLRRVAPIAEPADNDFRAATAAVHGRIGALKLVSATSYVDHAVDFQLDASDAAAKFGLTGATVYRDDRAYTIFNQEFRLSSADSDQWLAGASFLRADSHSEATLTASGTAPLAVETLNRRVTEYAVFGEGSVALAERIKATAGLRLFRTVAEDEAIERATGSADRIRKTALSPSLSLSWTREPSTIVYLRYAGALRPGGLAPSGQTPARRFDSDELGTIDLGFRHSPAHGRLTLAASLFYTDWRHIQSDYLLADGLVSTRNAGRGRIIGAEASGDWRLPAGFRIAAGLSVQDARLVSSEAGEALKGLRLPITPDMTGRLAINRIAPFRSWTTNLGIQANYTGQTRLSFDEDLDRRMGRYVTLAATAAISRDALTLSARVDNLLDVRADSFAFGNPFSILAQRQYTPLRPRTLTLSIGRAW